MRLYFRWWGNVSGVLCSLSDAAKQTSHQTQPAHLSGQTQRGGQEMLRPHLSWEIPTDCVTVVVICHVLLYPAPTDTLILTFDLNLYIGVESCGKIRFVVKKTDEHALMDFKTLLQSSWHQTNKILTWLDHCNVAHRWNTEFMSMSYYEHVSAHHTHHKNRNYKGHTWWWWWWWCPVQI